MRKTKYTAAKKSNHIAKYKPWLQLKKQPTRKKKPAPYMIHDTFFEKAKKEWYRARSVYKLKEIQEQYLLIEPHMSICDIWAAPGSFMQYINRITDKTNLLIGIDIKAIDKFSRKNIQTIQHSIFDFDTLKPKVEQIFDQFFCENETGLIWDRSPDWGQSQDWDHTFDLIVSDIAPNTTGRKDVDQFASVELNIEILKFAEVFLKQWWNLLLKVFKGEDFSDLTREIKKHFDRFTEYKPLACRDRSFETYLICFSKK